MSKTNRENLIFFLDRYWPAPGDTPRHQSVSWSAPEVFFFFHQGPLVHSRVQHISGPLWCNGFSTMCSTSNLRCLRAFLSLVFTPDWFLREPAQSVTLKTNKTTSAPADHLNHCGQTGPAFYLGRQQFQRLQIGQAADAIIYHWSRMSTLRCTSLLFSLPCLLPAFVKRGHFMDGERKYFYLVINGSMEMCLPVPGNNVHSVIMDIKQLVDWVLLSQSLVDPWVCVTNTTLMGSTADTSSTYSICQDVWLSRSWTPLPSTCWTKKRTCRVIEIPSN